MEVNALEEAAAVKSVEGWVIMVTNLHEEVSEEDVSDRFSEYGTVQNLHLNLDRRTGYVKGYALIEYKNAEEAERAVNEANGEEYLDKKLEVDFAFVRPPAGKSTDPKQRMYGPSSSVNKMASSRARSKSPSRG